MLPPVTSSNSPGAVGAEAGVALDEEAAAGSGLKQEG